MKNGNKFITLVCQPEDGNKGAAGYLTVIARSEQKALDDYTQTLIEKLVASGHSEKHIKNISTFEPKGKDVKAGYRYFEGDERL